MIRQSGMEHIHDLRMLLQIFRDGERIALMAFHSQCQGLHAAHKLIGVGWAEHCTDGIVKKSDLA
ncbi:hypothetical protein D3C73_1559950 [compost metagenome]